MSINKSVSNDPTFTEQAGDLFDDQNLKINDLFIKNEDLEIKNKAYKHALEFTKKSYKTIIEENKKLKNEISKVHESKSNDVRKKRLIPHLQQLNSSKRVLNEDRKAELKKKYYDIYEEAIKGIDYE
jgi:hypothetical protein